MLFSCTFGTRFFSPPHTFVLALSAPSKVGDPKPKRKTSYGVNLGRGRGPVLQISCSGSALDQVAKRISLETGGVEFYTRGTLPLEKPSHLTPPPLYW